MRYRVLLKPAADRQLQRVRGVAMAALRGVILNLADEPRPRGASKLHGGAELWRLRFRIDGQSWRVVYEVDDKLHRVVVARVARRDEGTYRGV